MMCSVVSRLHSPSGGRRRLAIKRVLTWALVFAVGAALLFDAALFAVPDEWGRVWALWSFRTFFSGLDILWAGPPISWTPSDLIPALLLVVPEVCIVWLRWRSHTRQTMGVLSSMVRSVRGNIGKLIALWLVIAVVGELYAYGHVSQALQYCRAELLGALAYVLSLSLVRVFAAFSVGILLGRLVRA